MNGYLNCGDLIDPVVTFANSPESYMQYVDRESKIDQNGRYVLIQRNEKMKIGTQNQAFFPAKDSGEISLYQRDGLRSFARLTANCWSTISKKSKSNERNRFTGDHRCGYDGWIGDFIEERRLNGLKQIERILEALAEVGVKVSSFRQHGACLPSAYRR